MYYHSRRDSAPAEKENGDRAALTKKTNKNYHSKKFEQILLEAIDDGLASLGEGVKTSVYYHLKDKFQLDRADIPYRLNDFSDSLDRIFGLGARHLEILFMKRLHAKLEIALDRDTSEWVDPQIRFPEYVLFMKQNVEKASVRNGEIEILVDPDEQQETLHLRT